MNRERIDSALRKATDTRSVIIDQGVISSVAEVFRENFGDQPAIIIADENTFKVAGQLVYEMLTAAGNRKVAKFIFPGQPVMHADYKYVTELVGILNATDAVPIAVGSGTINDLTKLSSYLCHRRYMVVTTAASMDGYTSFGASITKNGYKQTMACPAPQAVLGDVNILAAAPPRMTGSGYADLVGKITAGADWLIADALGVEPINHDAWEITQSSLREWISKPEDIKTGDKKAIENLIEGLIMTGLAMQVAQSSRPASGSEHLFSHLWEMQGLTNHGEDVSHGFKVGLGTIAAAALYDVLLGYSIDKINITEISSSWPTPQSLEELVRRTHSNPQLAESAVKESLAKYIDSAKLAQRLTLVKKCWPELKERLQKQLIPANQLYSLLKKAGCPCNPEDIGLTNSRLKESYLTIRQIRRRYTAFDLSAEAGLLYPIVERLFAPKGFWGK